MHWLKYYFVGEYQYQFTQLGTFYIWSGFVDEWGIKNYAGQIEVVEKDSSLGEISVRVAEIEALQDVGGSLPFTSLRIWLTWNLM